MIAHPIEKSIKQSNDRLGDCNIGLLVDAFYFSKLFEMIGGMCYAP